MIPFIQQKGQSTIEHWKKILVENNLPSFGAFAYVTDSGVAQVTTYLGDLFGTSRRCRWVFGFDYGRSQPTAIRKLADMGQSEIRIYDGDYVVQSTGFRPRINYHLKTALTQLENGNPCKQIIGSGNLSASGLASGIEAGCLIDYSQINSEYGNTLLSTLEEIWENAAPLERVIEEYERKYVVLNQLQVSPFDNSGDMEVAQLFWIDVGYVTKNREKKPGNQFDLPRGSHKYIGLPEVLNPALNSNLGQLKIRTPTGDVVERPLRYGNNAMEKLTLPIPETHGYECYDGKILTFKVDENEVELEAFEHDDFFRVYGSYINYVDEMRGGRKYGTIKL
jgi:hypothetical protein